MSFSNEHLTRQLDIIPMGILDTPIKVVGAGAIGGWTTLGLAKMGFGDITVFDADLVSTVNLNSQFFRHSDVGSPKVEALRDMVQEFTGIRLTTHNAWYQGGALDGVVISAVDSMEVRKLIWDSHKDKCLFTKGIVDPRMGAESALLYVMDPMVRADQLAYEKTLYSDSQAVQERCTAKATIYTAHLLSGLVCKAVKDLLTQPDYLRVAQWDIAANQFLGFSQKVG